ncbi:hypothetical protein [Niallia sp. FSL R7-0271]|uniref:hypothetical protein n=1 Tax=Niallia sp. FSL R7-0271 TaxID=2921678 RepID=UPI0030F507F2
MTENPFLTKLALLKSRGYIREQTYDEVLGGYTSYVDDEKLAAAEKAKTAVSTYTEKQVNSKPVQPKKPKKIRSKEEIRERNISYLLYIGVFLLIIGGLFVATSNWSTMADWMKAASIFFVSILFFGFGYVAKVFVKIEKTAFAFTVLGGLFLPIGFLSVSYFRLAGLYLSVTGDGKYLFGVMAGIILVPVYHKCAQITESLIFRILVLIAVSAAFAFAFAALYVPLDVFVLLMVIFNLAVILFMGIKKKYKWASSYYRLLPVYLLVHMAVTTLFLSFFYESAVFQGWNFLLMSAVYFLFLLRTKKKDYHFFVTVTAVAGTYQLFSNDLIFNFQPLAFAALGAVFLLLKLVRNDLYLGKTWEYTSIAVGLASLLYSAVFHLELFWYGSLIVSCTFLLLGAQFVYLSRFYHGIIAYFPAVLWGSSLWQLAVKWDFVTNLNSFLVTCYVIAFFLLLVLGIFNKFSMLQLIKRSSTNISIWALAVCAYGSGMFFFGGWEVVFMLILLGVILLYIQYKKVDMIGFSLLDIVIPIVGYFAFAALYTAVPVIRELGIACPTALGSITLLSVCKWYSNKNQKLGINGFYISQIMYMVSILLTVTSPSTHDFARTAVYAAGIFVFYLFYRKKREKSLAWLVSAVACFTYFSAIDLLFDSSDWLFEKAALYGWIFLMTAAVLIKNKDFKMPLSFIGHLYLPFALLLDVWFNYSDASIHFVFSFFAYAASAYFVKQKYFNVLLQYGAYLSFFLFFTLEKLLVIDSVPAVSQAFIFTSILLLLHRVVLSASSRSLLLFFIPFSIIGIISWQVLTVFSYSVFFATLFYLIIYLVITHLDRKHFLVAPAMLLLFISAERLIYAKGFLPTDRFILYTLIGVALVCIGMYLYKKILLIENGKVLSIDFYTISGFIAFLFLVFSHVDVWWMKAVPGLLMALTAYIQKGRVSIKFTWTVKMLALLLLLQPYYILLHEWQISVYYRMELLLFPWFLLFWASKKIMAPFKQFIIRAEWGFLLIAAVSLCVDGLRTSAITDAIILGTLSLLSVIGGFYFRYKSYFFIGIGVLLLNVLLQTRPFWGVMPWWAYLLIAGTILIASASLYEMQKQKSGRNISLYLKEWKNKLAAILTKWN